jgi:NADH:ubiquinone oxidoreductase subunit 3 (subunit A)
LDWTQFTVRYYIFAILFLIFDVEAVFLFPWVLVFLETATFVFYAMIIFIAILLFGVAYAWRKGVLQWR